MMMLNLILWLVNYNHEVNILDDFNIAQTGTNNIEYSINSRKGIMQINEKQSSRLPASVLLQDVPFTAQAPFGDWQDERQGYGCEEANLVMAMHWVNGQDLTPEIALQEILALTDFEVKNYQYHQDLSLADTYRVVRDYYKYTNAFTKYDIGVDDIKGELALGNLVIIPINGQVVNNPHYSALGPAYHQISVIGYDDTSQTLITHDPGTKNGANYKYTYQEIAKALRDYSTGHENTHPLERTAMLVIKP